MNLSELIDDSYITVGWPENSGSEPPAGADKWQLLDACINFLAKRCELTKEETEESRQLVIDREHSLTTGIGEGVAIPHASVPFLEQARAMLTVLPQGFDFESIDRRPVYLVVLMLVPKNQFQKHIRTLAGIARLANDADFRSDLVEQEKPKDVWEKILHREGELSD